MVFLISLCLSMVAIQSNIDSLSQQLSGRNVDPVGRDYWSARLDGEASVAGAKNSTHTEAGNSGAIGTDDFETSTPADGNSNTTAGNVNANVLGTDSVRVEGGDMVSADIELGDTADQADRFIGSGDVALIVTGVTGVADDPADFIEIEILESGSLELELSSLTSDVNLSVLNSRGALVASRSSSGLRDETLNLLVRGGELYTIAVEPGSDAVTSYELRIKPTPLQAESYGQTRGEGAGAGADNPRQIGTADKVASRGRGKS